MQILRTITEQNSIEAMSDEELDLLVTQHAAECVEELLNSIRANDGVPWFLIIERKMKKLIAQVSKP